MAIKAKAQITLSAVVDVDSVYKYYKLQSSTASAPSVPTSYPPTGWTETEPSYTSGSTNTLYTVECNVFSDGTWSYTNVCKSSAYEAAKAAYNKATNAEKVATNYLNFSNNGLVVGNMTASSLGKNVLIDSEGVSIRDGSSVLSKFEDNSIILGQFADNSTIELCGGAGKIVAEGDSYYDWNDSLKFESKSLKLDSERYFQYAHKTSTDGGSIGEVKVSSDASWEQIYDDPDGDGISTKEDDGIRVGSSMDIEVIDNQNGKRLDAGMSVRGKISRNGAKADYDEVIGMIYARNWNTYDYNFLRVYPDKTTMDKDLDFTSNNTKIFSRKPDGSKVESFNLCNASGNIVLGYGNYEAGDGNTNVYGNDVYIGPKLGGGTYRPYYRPGDSITIDIYTAGFVTNANKEIWFTVPLCKPIIGVSTVTPSSINGFILRENDKYTHGSGASTYAKPSSYVGYLHGTNEGIKIKATFSNITNSVNNSPIGVRWSGKITFA